MTEQKLQKNQLRQDLTKLLSQGEGMRYLARLVALSGALSASYSPSGHEATAYNEGLRRMGLLILAETQEHAPELLPSLLLLCLPGNARPEAPSKSSDEPPIQ